MVGWSVSGLGRRSHRVSRLGVGCDQKGLRRDKSGRARGRCVPRSGRHGLVAASVASLVSVGFVLVDAANRSGLAKGGFIGLAVGSVIAAWLAVHSVYMLRYARLYYADPVGGISFHADDEPDYRDFAYVALTIGMTFQVSDTDLTRKRFDAPPFNTPCSRISSAR